MGRDDVTVEQVLAYHGLTEVYVLLPTSPFRSAQSIRLAHQAFLAAKPRGAGGLLSLVPTDPPEHTLRLQDGWIQCDPHFGTPRQHLAPAYRHDGGHWIITAVPGSCVPFFTPPEEALDINTPEDLDRARWTLAQRPAAAI
jgi:CMP-N-acetylneuraminic acid synthetase